VVLAFLLVASCAGRAESDCADCSDGGAAGTGGSAAISGAGANGGAGSEAGAGGAAGAPVCPSHQRLQLAQPKPFCIDRFEVSAGEYSEFLELAPGWPGVQGTFACQWKSGLNPGTAVNDGSLPVTGVDWCDAWAFCEWRGARLCGRIGGGSTDYSDLDDVRDEWYWTCSAGGEQQYPYGNNYSDACATESTAPVPAQSLGCEGPEGIHHLSGNVFEWVNSCELGEGPVSHCRVRGGGWDWGAVVATCAYGAARRRDRPDDQVGFRCCSG